jgi:hypothetical protein
MREVHVVGIRRWVPILCAVAACSGGEVRQQAIPRIAADPTVAATPAGSLAGGATLTPADLDAADAARATAPAAELRVSDAPPLSAGLAEELGMGSAGLAFDMDDGLAIAFEEQSEDRLELVLGATSVMDEHSLPAEAMDPVPAALEDLLQ